MPGFSVMRRQQQETTRTERIPATLQAVVLASNRGKEVYAPPPSKVASKTYAKNWFFQRQTSAPIISKSKKQNRRYFWGFQEPPPCAKQQQDAQRGRRMSKVGRRSSTGTLSPSSSVESTPPSSPRASPKSSAKTMLEKASDNVAAPPLNVPTQVHVQTTMSPQGYLDSMLRSRGYSTQKFKVLETAYHNRPTPLQIASHHVKLVEHMRAHNGKKLQELIQAGLSPNPCNSHGESLIHNVARRGDYKLLHTMVHICGSSVQVSDDHGRTPMHDACWSASASFPTIDIILQQDPRLFHMQDARGATPLSYIRTENWSVWLKFIKARADIYWPARNVQEDGPQGPPELCTQGPNTRPLPDPEGALSTELAAMVAAERMTPSEAMLLNEDDDDDTGTLDSDDLSDSDFDDSEFDSDYDSDDDSEDEEDHGYGSILASGEEAFGAAPAKPKSMHDSLVDPELLAQALAESDEDDESDDDDDEDGGEEEEEVGGGGGGGGYEATDRDDTSLFDESEIADLIFGITAPKTSESEIRWSK